MGKSINLYSKIRCLSINQKILIYKDKYRCFLLFENQKKQPQIEVKQLMSILKVKNHVRIFYQVKKNQRMLSNLMQGLYYQKKKLKNIYNSARQQTMKQIKSFSQGEIIHENHKEIETLEKKLQEKTRLFNLLVSENNKLKQQVNSERNQRVIYFNIYKNLEHQIRFWQEKYKDFLIQRKASEIAVSKLEKILAKMNEKIERESIISPDGVFSDKGYFRQIENSKTKKNLERKLLRMFSHKSLNTQNEEKLKKQAMEEELEKEKQNERYLCESKKSFLKFLENNIKNITESYSLEQAEKKINQIKIENEKIYSLIEFQEENGSIKDEQIKKQQKLLELYSNSDQQSEEKVKKEKVLKKEEEINEICTENTRIQGLLSKKLNMNLNDLSNEQVLRHTLRFKSENSMKDTNKLERLLNQAKKQKGESKQFMNFNEITLSILNHKNSLQ